jgi:hypothetical protein
MSLKLARPIADYLAHSNTPDAERAAATFAEDASVLDEGHEHRGRAAIHAWKNDVLQKYHPKVEVLGAEEREGRTIVTGRVSGDFPGSPVTLRYAFTLRGDAISRLEIVP